MSYSHRIFIYGPVAALVALLAGYSLYWWASKASFEKWIDAANHHEAMPGVAFDFADKTIGGFPFRLDAVLGGVTVRVRGRTGDAAWRAEKVAIHSLVYGRDQFIFEAAGLQSFAFPRAGASPQVYYLTPGTARAGAFLRNGKLARLDLDLAFPKGTDASAGEGAARDFSAMRAQLHFLSQDAADVIAVSLKIDGAKIGAGYHWQLGHDIDALELAGSIAKASAFDGLLSGDAAFDESLEAWRTATGALTVESLKVTSDAAQEAQLYGTLTLDAVNNLEGNLGTADDKLRLVFTNSEIR